MNGTPAGLDRGGILSFATSLRPARPTMRRPRARSTPLRPAWFRELLLVVGAGASLTGCKPQQPAGASVSQVAVERVPQVSYVLRNPEGPAAGYRVSTVAPRVHNPYGEQFGAIEEGRFLYIRMNCAYCHAFDGTGGMGPDLTDNQWRYGSSDADIFETIYRGRAQGMPAWGNVLTEDQIWKLVSYVRSLGDTTRLRYAGRAADVTRKTSPNSLSR
jgi:mono/diheme cytochrome c family protein